MGRLVDGSLGCSRPFICLLQKLPLAFQIYFQMDFQYSHFPRNLHFGGLTYSNYNDLDLNSVAVVVEEILHVILMMRMIHAMFHSILLLRVFSAVLSML
jgi:hypothetical protein